MSEEIENELKCGMEVFHKDEPCGREAHHIWVAKDGVNTLVCERCLPCVLVNGGLVLRVKDTLALDTCWDDRDEGKHPRDYAPTGFEYRCILTPYGKGRKIIWYDGLSKEIDIFGGILLPRNVCQDGSMYFFKPVNKTKEVEK